MAQTLIGTAAVNGTTYQVYQLATDENSIKAGIRGNYALEGPNGATYFVTDFGSEFRLNSVACGGSKHQRWAPSPRPLRGLTRSHLSLFLDSTPTAGIS